MPSTVDTATGLIHDTWSDWARLAWMSGSAPASTTAADTDHGASSGRAPRRRATSTVTACAGRTNSENQFSRAVVSMTTP